MLWKVELHEDFEPEFRVFSNNVQDELLAKAKLIESFGPGLGRPHVDTLKGSKHANLKELRFDEDGGEWRVAFAFDPKRKAILLVAGDKKGKNEARFYKKLIDQAELRLDQHLNIIKKEIKYGNSNSKNTGQSTKKTTGKNKGKS